ncbi:hypothetical protein [Plebeiibacterium sediminum]|uniref:Uncharacterized protein n=1 Tax=Plebeiibacterium sediminum TaxID=2992112 RepID=A0AAE3SET0_9BACT|nr:hypothetical protein [Plebeiobacterium sediminum]MCW3786511.1 hypothetical protein [Plebeiobacterium sediminum]
MLECNTTVVQVICRQSTHAYCSAKVLHIVADLEEDDYLCADFDLCKNEPTITFDFGFESPFNKNFSSFILFEADVSPPLYFSLV